MPTPSDAIKVATLIKKWADAGNSDKLDAVFTSILQNKGIVNKLKGMLGKQPIANPQANWEKLLYTPSKFGKNSENLTDEQKKKKLWNSIQAKNVWGDVLSGAGATGGAAFGALASMAKGAANTSATQAQKNLYGATPEDRFAASAIPMYSGLAALLPVLSGIAANRLYQNANEQRADYLRALMGAQYNNMDVPGMYADSWRKLQEGTDNPFLTTTGGTN